MRAPAIPARRPISPVTERPVEPLALEVLVTQSGATPRSAVAAPDPVFVHPLRAGAATMPMPHGASAGASGAYYGAVVSLSITASSGGAVRRLGKTKLSTNTSIPKATKPHAARLRIPMPIEIDM
jgi:hypothetical protein